MKIGVLGTGLVGQTLATKLVHLGHEVMMGSRDAANPKAVEWANKENPDPLHQKNQALYQKRALFGTFAEAAEFGEVIFNCTLGSASLDALYMARTENLNNKILVDTANPIDYSDEKHWKLTVCNTDSLGEQIQRAFPRAKVVKSLNTINANVIVDPEKLVERTDIFVSGNSAEAKATVSTLLRSFGWKSIIDLGDITTSRAVEMYVVLWRTLRLATNSHRFNIKVVGT